MCEAAEVRPDNFPAVGSADCLSLKVHMEKWRWWRDGRRPGRKYRPCYCSFLQPVGIPIVQRVGGYTDPV